MAHAQIWRGGFGFNAPPRHPAAHTFAGAFNHCSGSGISERGSDTVEARGIADAQYFYRFSPDTYSVGIDVVLYALTH